MVEPFSLFSGVDFDLKAFFGGSDFWISSIKHQNFSGHKSWKYKRLNRAEKRMLLARSCVFHIHSKTACRGVSERQWRSCANRPSRQARPSPSAPAKKARNHAGSGLFLFSFYQPKTSFPAFFYQTVSSVC